MLKVILVQDVKGQGKKGETKEVSEGYARNFLLPRKFAVEASEGNMNNLQAKNVAEDRRKQEALQEAVRIKELLEKDAVTLYTKVGEGGKFFGAITSKHIVDVLASNGINVDKRKIELSEPIKGLGTFNVTAKLHPEAIAKLTVHIRADE